jgi:hypothetical protein
VHLSKPRNYWLLCGHGFKTFGAASDQNISEEREGYEFHMEEIDPMKV